MSKFSSRIFLKSIFVTFHMSSQARLSLFSFLFLSCVPDVRILLENSFNFLQNPLCLPLTESFIGNVLPNGPCVSLLSLSFIFIFINYISSLSFIFCKTPPLSLLPSPSLEMFCQMDLSSLFYLHLL